MRICRYELRHVMNTFLPLTQFHMTTTGINFVYLAHTHFFAYILFTSILSKAANWGFHIFFLFSLFHIHSLHLSVNNMRICGVWLVNDFEWEIGIYNENLVDFISVCLFCRIEMKFAIHLWRFIENFLFE